jgi:dolichol-phosphate mannosyltransferase
MPRVSVVIPTINESGTIEELIDALQEHRDPYDLQIIIVDDSSTDGTIEATKQLNRRHGNITLIERGCKLGFGTAITDGLKTALTQNPRPDLITTMDADLSHDPHQLPQLIQQCTRNNIVIGSRYTPGGEIHGWDPYRKTVSWGANLLARVFANIPTKDCTSGYRCYGVDLVQAILPSLESTGYDIQIEILAEATPRGFEIKETPIRFQDRTTGESKLKSGQMWEFAKRLYKLFRKSDEWIRVMKFSIVGLSGTMVNEAIIWTLTEKIGLYYLYSGILSSEAAVLNNFLWNDKWTFKDKVKTSAQTLPNRFIKFHISRFSSLIIGFIILAVSTEILKFHYLISNLLSILLVLSYNYLTSKGWVWS